MYDALLMHVTESAQGIEGDALELVSREPSPGTNVSLGSINQVTTEARLKHDVYSVLGTENVNGTKHMRRLDFEEQPCLILLTPKNARGQILPLAQCTQVYDLDCEAFVGGLVETPAHNTERAALDLLPQEVAIFKVAV
jgi:hypothetical protein